MTSINTTNGHSRNDDPSMTILIPSNNNTQIVQRPVAQPVKKLKKKRRDKSDLGDDFVAPDGGWGWLVAVSAGVHTLTTFALAQQFGIIFREHMLKLGINSSQLTTIINTQIAVSAITGLLNGPMFRRYTFRQVALVGSFLTFLGLFFSAFADTFMLYVLSFSLCYGFGRGLAVSASSLAVNTYFKQKRRTATAYQFGVAGLGPIVLPYVATYLLQYFGVQGTVMLFAGISFHTIACSLIYQPVRWHVKKSKDTEAQQPVNDAQNEEESLEQIADPETQVITSWYGSRSSLNSASRNRSGSWDKTREKIFEMQQLNGKKRQFSTSESIKEEEDHELRHDNEPQQTELTILNTPQVELTPNEEEVEEKEEKLSFLQKIVVFFDLDLLRDFGYVNLAVGLTLINFVEINFAILTPFILSDFGFGANEIALAMSLLGFFDLVIRFLIPLITARVSYSNKTLFAIGILGMCLGRFILSFTNDFYVMIAIFCWLGLNKAFRTVCWSLIIPGYVPLKRLPAAAGLQLLMSGLFSLACGPLIGLIRDSTNYAFTLNFLNSLCVLAILLWVLEDFYRKHFQKTKPIDGELN
ncbi:monocarboxylate transporter 9-like [Teleopsis dalmanni]|uniref:monocarboxylate transporter 9-like n=1 Tax=Teleopsis dalmanni TaxID=139649 RepID=UPI0018CF045D|nr:monocarboxylate transporter 9-like [Teleopsis dalmanni]XP_037937314.1 monocarboxylate transporter 9-like [Teleopsis dalmanni]